MFVFSDPLQLASSALGAVMGALYGLSGFNHDGRGDELSKNPRVKNLQYILFGFVALVIGNIQALSKQDVALDERAVLIGDYLLSVLIGVSVTIVAMASFVALSAASRARYNPAFNGRIIDLVVEYLQYGFKAYRARGDAIEKGDPASGLGAPASLAALGTSLGTLLAVSDVTRLQPRDAARADDQINLILDGIEGVVKLFGSGVSDLEVATNFMRVVGTIRPGDELLFTNRRPISDFGQFLVFVRYRLRNGPPVCIPIERLDKRDWLLPGAPIAVAETRASCINTRKLKFRNKVPKSVRTEIESFFKGAEYVSVLSVPIMVGRDVVGVVNIETNHLDVVGKGPSLLKELESALAPFCIILGPLIGTA